MKENERNSVVTTKEKQKSDIHLVEEDITPMVPSWLEDLLDNDEAYLNNFDYLDESFESNNSTIGGNTSYISETSSSAVDTINNVNADMYLNISDSVTQTTNREDNSVEEELKSNSLLENDNTQNIEKLFSDEELVIEEEKEKVNFDLELSEEQDILASKIASETTSILGSDEVMPSSNVEDEKLSTQKDTSQVISNSLTSEEVGSSSIQTATSKSLVEASLSETSSKSSKKENNSTSKEDNETSLTLHLLNDIESDDINSEEYYSSSDSYTLDEVLQSINISTKEQRVSEELLDKLSADFNIQESMESSSAPTTAHMTEDASLETIPSKLYSNKGTFSTIKNNTSKTMTQEDDLSILNNLDLDNNINSESGVDSTSLLETDFEAKLVQPESEELIDATVEEFQSINPSPKEQHSIKEGDIKPSEMIELVPNASDVDSDVDYGEASEHLLDLASYSSHLYTMDFSEAEWQDTVMSKSIGGYDVQVSSAENEEEEKKELITVVDSSPVEWKRDYNIRLDGNESVYASQNKDILLEDTLESPLDKEDSVPLEDSFLLSEDMVTSLEEETSKSVIRSEQEMAENMDIDEPFDFLSDDELDSSITLSDKELITISNNLEPEYIRDTKLHNLE